MKSCLLRFLKKSFPNYFSALSNEVAPFVGEYERMVTTVFNAYIGPKITAYLNNLDRTLRAKDSDASR